MVRCRGGTLDGRAGAEDMILEVMMDERGWQCSCEPLYSHYRIHDPLKHSNDPSKLCCFLKAKSASYILEKYEPQQERHRTYRRAFVPSMREVEER